MSASPCSTYEGAKQATGFTNPYGAGMLPYAPRGYTPAQIKGAYGISGYDSSGQMVAIIDAYAAPTIQQDFTLGGYAVRSVFGYTSKWYNTGAK